MRDRKQTILKPGLTKPTWHGFIDYAYVLSMYLYSFCFT